MSWALEVYREYLRLKELHPKLPDKEIAKLIRRPSGGVGISPDYLTQCKREAKKLIAAGEALEPKVKREGWLVSGDWHLCSLDFLPDSFRSAWEQATKWAADEGVQLLHCVVAGDIVGGRWVYPGQSNDQAVNVPHWQAAAAAAYMQRLEELAPPGLAIRWWVIKGNHDQVRRSGTDLALYAVMFAEELGLACRYCHWEWVADWGPERVLVVHGVGRSAYRPQSPSWLLSITKRLLQLAHQGQIIHRVVHGHSHWVSLGLNWGPVVIDSVGGWQRCSRSDLAFADRRPGMALYVDRGDRLDAWPVYPDAGIYQEELEDDRLPVKNLELVASLLKQAPLSRGR